MKIPEKISIRLSAEERTLLERILKEDGWGNYTGFIKYKLFGTHEPRNKIKANEEDSGRLLKYAIIQLAEKLGARNLSIINSASINKSDSSALREWKEQINRRCYSNGKLVRALYETIARIAHRLRLNDFFYDWDKVELLTQKQIDLHAEGLRFIFPKGIHSVIEKPALITITGIISEEYRISNYANGKVIRFTLEHRNKRGQIVTCYCISKYSETEAMCSVIKDARKNNPACVSGHVVESKPEKGEYWIMVASIQIIPIYPEM